MADKLPESALYEDEKLLQLYDLAIVGVQGYLAGACSR